MKVIQCQNENSCGNDPVMTKLVGCIANFSEGRRPDVVDAIGQDIEAVQGVALLDRSSDADHNRSVLTFAGTPSAVSRAAFNGISRAAELIDMEVHYGEHPRIGAADVIPFVPLSGVLMVDCVQIARALGQRVGQELDIPVYLYERAATKPNRENLADVRRVGYEGIRDGIALDPDLAPDFGPCKVGKSGATAIGARGPLIAFNVYLTTGDVTIAKKIATAVRQSSGGLPCVKALGMLVGGRAQVSMNLTDYRRTPMSTVLEAVRKEASRLGFGVHHSELVGLIPQDALLDTARLHLSLDSLDAKQIIESWLATAKFQGPDYGGEMVDRQSSTS